MAREHSDEESMEVVTLAHVTLSRPGSASGHSYLLQREVTKIVEVRDERPETLRELVEAIAEAHGESRGSLKNMQQVHAAHFAPRIPGAVVFNIQGPRTQYSAPYAVCIAYPALKVGKRYFKLEEVDFS